MIYGILHSFLNLLYPPCCLHCCKGLGKSQILCRSCVELLDFLDPQTRCPKCFFPHAKKSICFACRKYDTPFTQQAAVFAYEGPAASLIRQMKYGQQTYLAKGIAGFMLNQWAQLQWPVPDIIIPVPQSTSHWLERGFNQSGLIAKQFAKGIDKTFAEPIKRNSGDYSQAGLKKDQRKKLTNVRFSLHKPELLTDKTVLLIDDVSTTGATLKQCGSIIVQAGPRALYALTFCKA